MSEPVEWLADGGLAQARQVFLQGCGLPQAWAGQAQWRILETGFGLGLNFLAAWRAWQDDPQRPGLLHFTSIEAWPVAAQDILRSAQAHPELAGLAQALAAQWVGLLPGVHRLSFEGGRVLLTLRVGDVAEMLREQPFTADSVFLGGFDPRLNAPMWTLDTLKAVARLCRRGTALASWTVAGAVLRDLAQCGFVVDKVQGLPPKRDRLHARFDPAWEPKGLRSAPAVSPGRAVVVGAGLAGAAVAASLARRGWQVEVLDAADRPASGASALPAGLLAPHQSPDDNLLSRLTRCGVRTTLQQARALLREGLDWQLTGVLEHRLKDRRPPMDLGPEGQAWTRLATAEEAARAGLPATASAAWHALAGWINPSALVAAWLAQPGVRWRGGARVARLQPAASGWQLLDEAGQALAQAELVVVAAAHASAALLDGRIVLQPVRGQVAWGRHAPGQALPPWALNGNGHFIPDAPIEGAPAWITGSTYVRGDSELAARPAERLANLERLRELSPALAAALQEAFERGEVHDWTGVRCASADRRPLVGALQPGLWACTAMGSRGLTFAALCGELLAARLHGEPLPLPRKLAAALALERQTGAACD